MAAKTTPLRDEMVHREMRTVHSRTRLPTDEEQEFQKWFGDWAKREHMNPNPDAPEQDFDYRGAFKKGVTPPRTSKGEHWPSDDKDDDHAHLVVGGFNTKTGERVPGTRRETSVDALVELGWDRKTAQVLVRRPEPGTTK